METNKDIFEEKPKSSLAKVLEILSTMASKPSGFIGLAILIFHVILAVTSPWFAPYDYKSINPDGFEAIVDITSKAFVKELLGFSLNIFLEFSIFIF